jgi:aspartate carbamoyltransferase catalytic subunit
MKRKDLLGLKDLSAVEIVEILDCATEMKKLFAQEIRKSAQLAGKNVTTLFYENSTRTFLWRAVIWVLRLTTSASPPAA